MPRLQSTGSVPAMVMFLAGGGTPEQEMRVWQDAFAGEPAVLHWPFALSAERVSAAGSWLVGALGQLSLPATVTVWESLDGHHPSELDHFDVIAVGGGLTSRLARHLRDHRFDRPLAAYIEAGGTYYGGSAGAILPCAEITLAGMIEDDPASASMPGLALLADAGILPHADTFPRELAGDLASALGHDVISLPENSGVRIEGAELTAIGPGVVRRTRPDRSSSALATKTAIA